MTTYLALVLVFGKNTLPLSRKEQHSTHVLECCYYVHAFFFSNNNFYWYFTGEMIVGPTKALFMDEISNGLDSSTTYQIVACLQQLAHISDATILVALLQPAPETFDLFDDIILMTEGKIVYHGPHSHILEFFEDCGFRCPERKGVADFLQEVSL